MAKETYTDRHIEVVRVMKLTPASDGSGGGSVDTDHWGGFAPKEVFEQLHVGDVIEWESKGSWIAGWRSNGRWLARHSDQYFEQKHEEFVANMKKREQEALDQHRDEWLKREQALPKWLRDRLATFHERGGEEFELEGWGYELIICELAEMYYHSGGIDTHEISAYADKEGTSGNQHGMAKSLAKAYREDGKPLGNTVAGLAPLTGKPFYGQRGMRP